MYDLNYLEVHEIHQLGDFWLQDLHCLLIDLHSIRLFIALHLRENVIANVIIKVQITGYQRLIQIQCYLICSKCKMNRVCRSNLRSWNQHIC